MMTENENKRNVSFCKSSVRTGFTLIELLVVIAIIGVLVGFCRLYSRLEKLLGAVHAQIK